MSEATKITCYRIFYGLLIIDKVENGFLIEYSDGTPRKERYIAATQQEALALGKVLLFGKPGDVVKTTPDNPIIRVR